MENNPGGAVAANSGIGKLLPVMFGFFVMGFCDVIGIGTNYSQESLNLTESVAGLLPMSLFVWFAICSIPTSLLMGRIGRRNTVILSMVISVAAFVVPLMSFNLTTCLITFSLLGIGNTILQVSLNPLVANVVSGKRLASSLTLGQFVKAISSFLAPFIAGFAAKTLGDWKLIFPIYGVITVLSALWLGLTPIKEEQPDANTTFGKAFGLLKDPYILMLFLVILCIVGIDVGMNVSSPKVMMERAGFSLDDAKYSISVYFFARTAGAFLGAMALMRLNPKKVFVWSMAAAIAAYAVVMAFGHGAYTIYATVALVGFFCANVFPIAFSLALNHLPEKGNEISGLMITGVAGGGIIPYLMGHANQLASGVIGGMFVILACMLYVLFASVYVYQKK